MTIIDPAPAPDIPSLEGRSLDSLSAAERIALAEDQLWGGKTAAMW